VDDDPFLEAAPATAEAWAAALAARDTPVLADTAEALEAMRANEDAFDANAIGEVMAIDPLMALKVLVHEATHRGSRVVTGPRTVTAALVMIGISPFFAAFGPQSAVEHRLAIQDGALAGFRRCMARARRGADIALAFAVHRADPEAASLHASVLLHEAAQMLVWCHAPTLALRVDAALQDEPGLRSTAAQERVLHASYDAIQQALAARWNLLPLLQEAGAPGRAVRPSDRIREIAMRMARHAGLPWDHPALVDDLAHAGELLSLAPDATMRLVQDI
jgi:hypothetical protein